MKHIIASVLPHFAAAAIVASAGHVHAAPFAYDGFEETVDGVLNAQSGGTGFSHSWVSQSTASIVKDNMSYSSGDISINGGNTYLRFKVSSQTAVFSRKIPTDAFPSDGSDIYISMLVRLPASAVATLDPDYFMVALSTSATDVPVLGPLFGPNADVGNVFGIRQVGNVFSSTVPTSGTTHLVVVKLSKKDKSYYQYASLIVDPSTLSEPAIEQWVIQESYNSNIKNDISKYCYLQGFVKFNSDDAQKCESDDVFEIDEVRLATSWSDAVCASDYGGIVPPPYFSISESGMSKTVSILNSIPGMTHYYTTDGTEPTAETGTAYSSPFSVSSYAVVKAIAVDAGGNASKSASVICSLESRWVGAGADDNWTTTGNWSPSGSPEGRSIVFGAEDRTKDSIVNSIISQDMMVRSLLFTNNTFAPAPTDTNKKAWWHVVQIAEGKTLTVNGWDENGYAFRMWSPETTGEPSMGAKFTGGGKLVIDSADADIITQFTSSNNKATTDLNLAGLSEFECTADEFTYCRGRRTNGTLSLARTGAGKNTFTLNEFYISDMHSGSQGGGTVTMMLGVENVINSDIFYVGAPPAGFIHAQSAAVKFATGLESPSVRIRAKDGIGRADMQVGSHGTGVDTTPRSMSATADFTLGSVDAKVGNLVVGNGRGYYWSNAYGNISGTLAMSAGSFDALSAVVGRTEYTSGTRNVEAKPCTGTFSLSGGDFTVQGNFDAAENSAGAYQGVKANISVSGGTLAIGGNMTLATRLGLATNIIADVNVSGGSLLVSGNLASGVAVTNLENAAHVVNLQANVTAAGGVIAVTNDHGTAELRIESGTLALQGGKVYADSLVLTNAASAVEVLLSGDGFATAEVGKALLGGTIKVSVADGFKPHGASEWTIVDGTLPRVGVFAAVELPEGYKVKYTPTGFMVANKSGLSVVVR